MPAEKILKAEIAASLELEQAGEGPALDWQTQLRVAGQRHLESLVEWARRVPHFTELATEDQVGIIRPSLHNVISIQVALLKGKWNELLIISLAHRSLGLQSGLLRYKDRRKIFTSF